jgi:hypothetical protein
MTGRGGVLESQENFDFHIHPGLFILDNETGIGANTRYNEISLII